MTILITGASGFIGKQLAEALSGQGGGESEGLSEATGAAGQLLASAPAGEADANASPAASTASLEDVERPHLVCLSRSKPGPALPGIVQVQGAFDRFEDLRALDRYDIRTVVHLAAVTGGSGEEDALAVNVAGTRRLYRYLLDRGCRKFITASSIAAVGGLDPAFRPLRLPIPDDHPCLATDAYGLSKAMVEQLVGYFHRQMPDAEFVTLRLGAVVEDSWVSPAPGPDSRLSIPFVLLSRIYVSDVVRALAGIATAPLRAGSRQYNLVGPDISSGADTISMLRGVLGAQADGYDLSYYEQPGHAFKPLFASSLANELPGFTAARSTR